MRRLKCRLTTPDNTPRHPDRSIAYGFSSSAVLRNDLRVKRRALIPHAVAVCHAAAMPKAIS